MDAGPCDGPAPSDLRFRRDDRVGVEASLRRRRVLDGQGFARRRSVSAQDCHAAQQADRQSSHGQLFQRAGCTGQANPHEGDPSEQQGQPDPQPVDVRGSDDGANRQDQQREAYALGHRRPQGRRAQPTAAEADDERRGSCERLG